MTDTDLLRMAYTALLDLHETGDTQVFDMFVAPVLLPKLEARLDQIYQAPLTESNIKEIK